MEGDRMEGYCGEIKLFPYYFSPRGWAMCTGQLLTIAQNQALYSLIGTKFGGNGTTNFMLPNLQGAEPVPGMAYYICVDDSMYPIKS